MPTMGTYSASKFALEGASEALWYEMCRWNIKVSLVQPGFIHSNSFHNVHWTVQSRQDLESGGVYSSCYESMGAFIENAYELGGGNPESISARIICVMKQADPALRVPATLDAYFFYLLRRPADEPLSLDPLSKSASRRAIDGYS